MDSPFFYLPWLIFSKEKILEEIFRQEDDCWWSAHNENIWNLDSSNSNIHHEPEIKKITDQISFLNKPIWTSLVVKYSKKDFRNPWGPMLQDPERDKKAGIKRTWDIIIPLAGGFIESPLEAKHIPSNTFFKLEPKGIPFCVHTNTDWEYTWMETVDPARITLHIRANMPWTREKVIKIWNQQYG